MVAERELMILVVATSVVTTGVVGFALCFLGILLSLRTANLELALRRGI